MPRDFLQEYNLSDYRLYEKYDFREIRAEEAAQAVQLEQLCFPPSEACRPEIMKERVRLFPETFLVAVSWESGNMVGFINGLATSEIHLRDAFFTDPALHDPEGSNIMLLGVAVHPDCRGQGIAREMMYNYLCREKERGRENAVLTCLKEKIPMYQHFGFQDLGESSSVWGGETWHEMIYVLTGKERPCIDS